MIGLLTATFVAGLVGSPHCIGMCGGFAVLCGGRVPDTLLWHAGRLTTYAGLGALAGAVGALVPGPSWLAAAVSIGLMLWFAALPKIPLADMTAIGFTTPIFIMLGAALVLGEKMVAARWVAALLGFCGVLIVVGPKLAGSGGYYNLVMLASAPMCAASFLLTKGLTRYETTGVILVWQSLTVTIFSLPLALLHWQTPTAWRSCTCSSIGRPDAAPASASHRRTRRS